MTEYKHRVYFSADDGVHGTELWVTDGTEDGTQLFADINPGALRSAPQSFKVAGGLLFFVTIVPDDRHFTVQTQLWVTDGTTEGTQMVFQEPGNNFGYAIDQPDGVGEQTALHRAEWPRCGRLQQRHGTVFRLDEMTAGVRDRATFLATIKVVPQSSVAPAFLSIYRYAWFVGFALAFIFYLLLRGIAGSHVPANDVILREAKRSRRIR